jgi:hypothetical protein
MGRQIWMICAEGRSGDRHASRSLAGGPLSD